MKFWIYPKPMHFPILNVAFDMFSPSITTMLVRCWKTNYTNDIRLTTRNRNNNNQTNERTSILSSPHTNNMPAFTQQHLVQQHLFNFRLEFLRVSKIELIYIFSCLPVTHLFGEVHSKCWNATNQFWIQNDDDVCVYVSFENGK